MGFEATIDQVSSEELDNLFKGTPAGTPNANNLVTNKEGTFVAPQPGDIDFVKDDEWAEEKTPEQLEADKKAAKEKEDKEKADLEANKGKTAEQIAADKKAAEDKKKTEAEAKKAEEGKKVPAEEINAVLKNTVEYLVKNGQWADWDGREDMEITEDVYANLAAKQDEYRVTSMFDELVDSTGAYGKAIIQHIKNGGNPDQVIDIFKEQKALEQIDASTEDGKLAVIEKYYKEVVGFKPDKVQKTLKKLITDEGVEGEYTDIKELYDKHYKAKLEEADRENKVRDAQEKQRHTTFVNNIKTTLEQDTTLTPQQRKVIASSMLDFKHPLEDGRKVNDFYVKFAEIQADPKEYIELVRFVMDREAYKASIKSKEETKAAVKTFSFVKGNAANGKTKSAETQIVEDRTKTHKGTDFSSFLK